MSQPSVETIRADMQRIRQSLAPHAKDVVDETRRLADWRTYFRDYPWACVGAAVAIGYLAVPNRPQIITPDADDLARLAKRNQLVVKQTPRGTTTHSLARSSASFLGNMLLRSAVAYFGQRVGSLSSANSPSEG